MYTVEWFSFSKRRYSPLELNSRNIRQPLINLVAVVVEGALVLAWVSGVSWGGEVKQSFYGYVDGNSSKNVKNDRFNKQNNNFAGVDDILSLPSFPQVLGGKEKPPYYQRRGPALLAGNCRTTWSPAVMQRFMGDARNKTTNSSLFFLNCFCSARTHF